jgi:hypothetical protein
MPPSVIMLSVCPVETSPSRVSAMLPGRTTAAVSPSRTLRRNSSTTTIAKNAPIRSASRTPPTEEFTRSAWSYQGLDVDVGGSALLCAENHACAACDSLDGAARRLAQEVDQHRVAAVRPVARELRGGLDRHLAELAERRARAALERHRDRGDRRHVECAGVGPIQDTAGRCLEQADRRQ